MFGFNNNSKQNTTDVTFADDQAMRREDGPMYGGLGFDPLRDKDTIPAVERLDLGGIPGGYFEELVCSKKLHAEPRGINEVLASTVASISAKAAEGLYDSQAIGLVESWIAEVSDLAMLQLEKEELRTNAELKAKEAAVAARKAVSEARKKREEDIRAACATV